MRSTMPVGLDGISRGSLSDFLSAPALLGLRHAFC